MIKMDDVGDTIDWDEVCRLCPMDEYCKDKHLHHYPWCDVSLEMYLDEEGSKDE